MKLYLFYILCVTLGSCNISNYFPQCKTSDPEIEKCILKGIEEIKPKLRDGIPEINLPSLEPFKMDQLFINSSITGATVQATVTNVEAYGGSNFTIEYLKVDLDDQYAGELKIIFPRLQVTTNYNTAGSKMLLFSISGDGKFKGSFRNVEVVAKGIASPTTKDGVEYLQLDSLTTDVTIGEGEITVNPKENSFAGRAAKSFIQWNPSVVLAVLSPVIDETTASIVKEYLNEVLTTVPIKDVLVE